MTDTHDYRNAADTPRVTLLIDGFYHDVPAAPGNAQINFVTYVPKQGWWGFGTAKRAAAAALAVSDFHPVHRVYVEDMDYGLADPDGVVYEGCAIDIVEDID